MSHFRFQPDVLYANVAKDMSETEVVLASIASAKHGMRLNWYPGQLSFGVAFDGEVTRIATLEEAVNLFCEKQYLM